MNKISIFNVDIPSIRIHDMPVWEGMQSKPGVMHSHDFTLINGNTGPIIQKFDDHFTNDIIDSYNRDDYNFITAPPGKSLWSISMAEGKMSYLREKIKETKINKVLEIGCGNTWFAQNFCEEFNPNQYMCIDPAIKEVPIKNISIIRDYFPSKKLEKNNFDVILAYNVLEHVRDPKILLTSIANSLSSDGIAVICVPDCKRQFFLGDINSLIHEHMTYYTIDTIKDDLNNCGLKIIEISSQNDLFTILVKSKSFVELVVPTSNNKPLFLKAQKAFCFLFNEFLNNLETAMSENKRIAFHGATHGLNTFLHVTEFNKYSFSIFDGDQSKHGKFLSAYQVPVQHASEIDYTNHDILVISAMSFDESIRASAIQRGYHPDQVISMGTVL